MQEEELKSLYYYMQEKGYSIRTLADKAGVGITTINYILNGRNGGKYYPRPNVRKKVCEVLGIEAVNIKEFSEAIKHHLEKRRERAEDKC